MTNMIDPADIGEQVRFWDTRVEVFSVAVQVGAANNQVAPALQEFEEDTRALQTIATVQEPNVFSGRPGDPEIHRAIDALGFLFKRFQPRTKNLKVSAQGLLIQSRRAVDD